MKKLLSLLSVLTISGTAIPTTIAASSYQKEEKLSGDINSQTNNLETLNRNKREIHIERNKVKFWHVAFQGNKMSATFKPNTWKEIISFYNEAKNESRDISWFKWKVYDKIQNGNADFWIDYRIKQDTLETLAHCIWNNWSKINNVWNGSDKLHSIRVELWTAGESGTFVESDIWYTAG